MIHRPRCAERYLVAVRVLTVKKAERIFHKALAAGVTELVLGRPKVTNKSLAKGRPALGAADRIDMKLHIFKAKTAKDRVRERNYGSI